MDKQELISLITYIIGRGLETIQNNTEGVSVSVDYVAVFAKNDEEFEKLDVLVKTLGNEIDFETGKTGKTYLLHEPLETLAGPLTLVKVRRPDHVRPQRGAPDFRILNYAEFKDKHIRKSGNFTLMLRNGYEMIEIKGVDVLVYIPDKPLTVRMNQK